MQSTKCRVAALGPSARKIRQSATNLRRDTPIDSCRMQKDARRVTARSGTRKAAVIYRLALRDRVRFDKFRKSREPGSPSISNMKNRLTSSSIDNRQFIRGYVSVQIIFLMIEEKNEY